MIGIDLVETKYFKQAVEKYGDCFLNKIFTDGELESSPRKLAGYFAIKEAIVKALGLRDFKWKDIEIKNDGSEIRISTDGINRIFSNKELAISVSSEKDYVIASALLIT